jgi:hypothetical protein
MKLCHYAECHCAESHNLFIGILNFAMLNVVMLSVVAPEIGGIGKHASLRRKKVLQLSLFLSSPHLSLFPSSIGLQ